MSEHTTVEGPNAFIGVFLPCIRLMRFYWFLALWLFPGGWCVRFSHDGSGGVVVPPMHFQQTIDEKP